MTSNFVKAQTFSKDFVQETYFNWLCSLVGLGPSKGRNYKWLLTQLHRIVFYPLLPRDNDRGGDGINLRLLFENENPKWHSQYLKGECTLLEMLIALAKRMDDIMMEPSKDGQTGKWFWEMLKNLGLDRFSDPEVRSIPDTATDEVTRIIDALLKREYGWNGNGGLFPLSPKYTHFNQKNVEIWYQMMAYLDENYSTV